MATIERELGAKPEEIYSQLTTDPIAAASLGQVRVQHLPLPVPSSYPTLALTPTPTLIYVPSSIPNPNLSPNPNPWQVYKGVVRTTGEEVAVKVQRPYVLETVTP